VHELKPAVLTYWPVGHSLHSKPSKGLYRPGVQLMHLSEPQFAMLAHTPVVVSLMDLPLGHFVHAAPFQKLFTAQAVSRRFKDAPPLQKEPAGQPPAWPQWPGTGVGGVGTGGGVGAVLHAVAPDGFADTFPAAHERQLVCPLLG
jgi:hypothetical protein